MGKPAESNEHTTCTAPRRGSSLARPALHLRLNWPKGVEVWRFQEGLAEVYRRLGVRESVLHLSSHTGLMQVLPGHPLAVPSRECQSLCREPQKRQGQTSRLKTEPNPGQQLSIMRKARVEEQSIGQDTIIVKHVLRHTRTLWARHTTQRDLPTSN